MAVHQTGDAAGWPTITALRLGFTVVAVLSLILGYFGLGSFLAGSVDYGSRPIDLFYYDLQLFVLGADPLQSPGPYPVPLEVARFAAPAATLYALFEITWRLFAVEVRKFRARLVRGHVIVCGDGAIADTLTRRLRAAGSYVVTVRPGAEEPNRAIGRWLTIAGDPRDPDVLRAAGVDHAVALYACGADDSAANAAVAFAAASARPAESAPLAGYVHIRDPDLCLTLQARYLGVDQPAGVRLDFFNIDDVAARTLFTGEPLRPVAGRAPRLVVVGATTFGRAILVEAARSWKSGGAPAAGPLPVAVVDEHARSIVDNLIYRYPFLDTSCRITPHDADLTEMLVSGRLRQSPDRAFICDDDADRAFQPATTGCFPQPHSGRSTPCSVNSSPPRLPPSRSTPSPPSTPTRPASPSSRA